MRGHSPDDRAAPHADAAANATDPDPLLDALGGAIVATSH
jgi:hypothetical protein